MKLEVACQLHFELRSINRTSASPLLFPSSGYPSSVNREQTQSWSVTGQGRMGAATGGMDARNVHGVSHRDRLDRPWKGGCDADTARLDET